MLRSFCPLDKKNANDIELGVCASCCTCYPYEEDEEDMVEYVDELVQHPYLVPTVPTDRSKKSNVLQRQHDATSNDREV